MPALFHRWCDGKICDTSRIVTASRNDLEQEAFRNVDAVTQHPELRGIELINIFQNPQKAQTGHDLGRFQLTNRRLLQSLKLQGQRFA